MTSNVVDFEDIAGTKEALLKLYHSWNHQKFDIICPDMEAVNQFNQKTIVKKFVEILNQVAV